ncbi:MAG: hypothetical protein JOZ92_05160, partial [Candidatus Dormibacteraeota bacterium]|nr:hypothetical protein [Candidatus Dormibacteraeota bacterium]
MAGPIRFLPAGLLLAHGLIHILGFLATWHIATGGTIASTPYVGVYTPGEAPVLFLGVVWLVAAIAFVASATALVTRRTWWPQMTAASALVSLVLCSLWWRDAMVGLVVNLALVAFMAFTIGRPSLRRASIGRHP